MSQSIIFNERYTNYHNWIHIMSLENVLCVLVNVYSYSSIHYSTAMQTLYNEPTVVWQPAKPFFVTLS